jgi:UDP-N-acetylglucosamine acyltransferase
MPIHPTAVIHPAARVAADAEIGPHAIVEAGAEIGPGCVIRAHAVIAGETVLGAGNEIGYGAVIGAPPQDLSFDPKTRSRVVVGEGNVFREYVTVHRGSKEGGQTTVGDRNYLMVGAHLGHDVRLGSGVILANNVLLGGHLAVGDRAFVGGAAAFHQFARIGRLAMCQGLMIGNRDVPPFCMAYGRSRIAGINALGLRRAGLPAETRQAIKATYHALFDRPGRLADAIEEARAQAACPEAHELIDFVAAPSKQGICAAGGGGE